ncbi:MAG TPA: NAD(P)H-dependent oxidoreductase [Verrucomicrobiae bacterium]|nr:NAD(P)H-dependent oxidoreductase [Verrucomicrobiae bacterium]
MIHIIIITASNRPGRFGVKPTEWVLQTAKARFGNKAEFSVVDVAELALPFLDEPTPALYDRYENKHTKAWAKTIAEADGFIIVTPEYNHSFPAPLKNAIDYLWKEWNHKPVSFVSYGSSAGGVRAVEHLRGVAVQVKLFALFEHVLIPNYWTQVNEAGDFTPDDKQNADLNKALEEITFWAEKLKAIRTDLSRLSRS